ncbi:hypothetical protein KKB43_04125 [Patescibacteria group bacterium]|nr:hypothetical protein [Patescibacteria group bacterium]MBU4580176.1 hypothetical protein [Patescibacteria group bacterium]
MNNKQINYKRILDEYPWIAEKKQKYILSPDSDGFLCGLLATNHLDGEIVGFYDGKIALIKNGINVKNCIFLDVDINRIKIKSVGHHMVIYNKRITHTNINYSNCIQPNILRNFDGRNDFQKKYPFGTIHLLLGIFQEVKLINKLPKNAIWPLLFTDGVWNNLFGYTENCIEWINYLGIDSSKQILNALFCTSHYSFYEIMLGLNDFLRMRDGFNAVGYLNNDGEYIVGGRNKRTGDKLKISNSNGEPINLVKNNSLFNIYHKEKIRIEEFITSVAKYVDWPYQAEKWSWNNFRLSKFAKDDFSKIALSNQSYISLMDKNPLSMAMTSGANIEFTTEAPDRLF